MSRKKLLSLMLSCSLVATTVFSNYSWNTNVKVQAQEIETETSVDETQVNSNEYGLCDNIQDGVILHCFDWKYNDIKEELPNIAAAGFTSIQTSPAQKGDGDVWYWLYQPQTFSIQSNALGSKSELQALCDEAEKYGIKIVVDVVANHTRSIGDDGLGGDCYHGENGSIDYSNRYQITHYRIGMPDLNSESTTVQNKVKGYIQELKGAGVDGIRWDAAKHIGLPSESCNFWPAVTGEGLYNYGEILNGPCNGAGNNDSLMKEYTSYISVTDDEYGDGVLNALNGGGVPTSIGNYSERGVSKNKLVYWAESHDTYSNNGEYGKQTAYVDESVVDKAYALLAGQGDATSLYFSRPYEKEKQRIMAGAKGSTHFTSKQVAAVNHLHNACVGEKDYYVQNGSAAAVCRETGAVIVKGSGSGQVTIENGGGMTAPGTYVDEVSGSEWTVTASTISGTVGDSGIAVIYSGTSASAGVSASLADGKSFSTDTVDVTFTVKNAVSATYSVDGGSENAFTDSVKVTLGEDTEFGSTVTVKVTATTEDGKTVEKTFTYTKKDSGSVTKNTVYFTKPSSWSGANIYAYVDGTTATKLTGEWPGKAMTDEGDSVYSYTFDSSVTSAKVIFAEGATGQQTPLDVEGQSCGYDYTGGKAYTYSESEGWTEVAVVEKTEKPKETEAPTEKPKETVKPTEKPKETEKPTEKPKETEKATETVKPTATVKPTSTPKETVKPTSTPKVTVKPTSTPKVTVAPTAPVQSMAPDNVSNDAASVTKPYYSITYEKNGGYFAVSVPASYTGEEDVTLIIPVREGYTFAGWYTDSAFTQSISVIKAGTTGNITVYAKWKKVSKPGKPVIATVKKENSTKKLIITLKKKVSGAVGYEALIAKNAKFTKGRRVVRFSGLSKVVGNMKAGTYYVKVRSYKVDSAGQRVYGKYCTKAKKVVLKK